MSTRVSCVVLIILSGGVLALARTLPFGQVESNCECSSNGYSGEVSTGRIGCKDYVGDRPFCYVADPARCDSDEESTRFPGATWVNCSQCVCAEDGVSNGVATGYRGCALHMPDKGPICYIKDGSTCDDDEKSPTIAGAEYKDCSNSEALYFAAEIDDVDMIEKLRHRKVDMAVSVGVTFPSGSVRAMTVAEYAAAHGSYKVLRNLIISANGAYNCVPDQKPSERFCDFSAASKCDINSFERKTMEDILRSYEKACH